MTTLHWTPRRYAEALLVSAALAAAVLLGGILVSRITDHALDYLTREPASVLEAPFYVGLLSNTTALVGVAATTSALLAWVILDRRLGSPWLAGGLVTACLLVNDVFLVDDHYLTEVGIPEALTSATLGALALAFVIWHRSFVTRHGPWLVAAALAGFAGAELLDRVSQHLDDVEDVLRFGSQVSWALFFVRAAITDLSTPTGAGSHRPRRETYAVALGYVGAALAVAVTVAGSRATGRPLEFLTREPADALDAPAYVGAISNLGALVWGVAATCALIAWTVNRSLRPLLFGGALTLVLLADDFYRLHEDVYPQVGIRQRFANATYFILVIAYLVAFRRYLRPRGGWLLVVAFGLLCASAALDILYRDEDSIEDGAKFVGIVVWATFFAVTAYEELRDRRKRAPT